MLIDAGLSPRLTARRLKAFGVSLHDLDAILLTHLDSDHFHRGWLRAIERFGLRLRIRIHHRHRSAAWRTGVSMRHAELFREGVGLDGCAHATSVLLAHDDCGSVGYVIEHASLRLGYATDLGCVSPSLLREFVDLDALAIESNYDRQMQVRSARPWFLKRRIMGGAGHLSNQQCLEAVRKIDERSRLAHVALLHLSRQCNDPELVRQLYAREAPHLVDRLTITSQRHPSPLLRVEPGMARRAAPKPAVQMLLFSAADSTVAAIGA
jgi:phosphoribosyl 1,2-cyclic phosphodiesterase